MCVCVCVALMNGLMHADGGRVFLPSWVRPASCESFSVTAEREKLMPLFVGVIRYVKHRVPKTWTANIWLRNRGGLRGSSQGLSWQVLCLGA